MKPLHIETPFFESRALTIGAGRTVWLKLEAMQPPGWDNTMFWNVYYIKGAFLSADSAFEIMQGMRTLGLRMLNKCINTVIVGTSWTPIPIFG